MEDLKNNLDKSVVLLNKGIEVSSIGHGRKPVGLYQQKPMVSSVSTLKYTTLATVEWITVEAFTNRIFDWKV